MWQDTVLTAGSIVLLVMLLPSLIGPHKPARLTSFLTGSMLMAFVVVYVSLDLYFAAAVTGLTGAAWLTLFAQGATDNLSVSDQEKERR